LIDDFDYEDESGKVTITLKDSLMDWQQQNVEEYYDFVEKSILEIWNSKYYNFANKTQGASAYMARTSVNTSYMTKSSRWSDANKICQATMLRCFCDIDGTPLFSTESSKQNNNISIMPKNILSIGEKIKNTKTKIQDVSISAYNIKKHKNEEILSSSVPFTWYNTRGTSVEGPSGPVQNYIVADWANYFVNVSTIRVLANGGYYGALVSARVKKPEHLFSFGDAVIEVNVSTTTNKSSKITVTKQSTKESTYSPKVNVSEDITDRSYLYVNVEDDFVIGAYSEELDELNLVGQHCVADGTINVLGDFFTDEGQTTFGSSSEFSEMLSSNELIQTESKYKTYIADKLVSYNLAQYIIEKVKKEYENGVECVEMEVTPSDYYDNFGNNVINSTGEKPLFEKYDIVTPYVVRNGVEQPYSTKDDGSPKSFRVIGIEYSYKGVIRQKLHLQEVV
jgi:hypothetical protein